MSEQTRNPLVPARLGEAGALLVLPLVALLLAVISAMRATPSTPTPQETLLAKSDSSRTGEPRDLVREFLQVDQGTGAELATERGWNLRTLIACVPDPTDSRFDYLFDQFIDAVQRAAEADGFVLDRFDLPWPEPGAGDEQEKTKERDWVAHPGTMLFRDRSDQQRLLLVFLIGETPTAGISGEALENALCLYSKSNALDPGGAWALPPRELRVLGPSFSGTAPSLLRGLQVWREGHPGTQIRIVTGSATAITDAFDGLSDASFESTVYPDAVVQEQLFEWLKKPPFDVDPGDIAILSEANTAYGQEGGRDAGGALHLFFPLHISKVRIAMPGGTTASDNALSDQTHGRVPLPKEGHTARDVPPMMSRLQISSAEMVLAALLETLSRERIRFIGLMASDILDQAFLAREIRENCPNARLFTFNADLTYLHTSTNQDFRGTLVVSPYPLFSLNQKWSFPYKGEALRLQFPNHYSQGVYNASLALLGRDSLMLEYGEPFRDPRRPPLWYSVVGRDDLWPIRAECPPVDSTSCRIHRWNGEGRTDTRRAWGDSCASSKIIRRQDLMRGAWSDASLIVFGLFTALCSFVAWALWHNLGLGAKLRDRFRKRPWVKPRSFSGESPWTEGERMGPGIVSLAKRIPGTSRLGGWANEILGWSVRACVSERRRSYLFTFSVLLCIQYLFTATVVLFPLKELFDPQYSKTVPIKVWLVCLSSVVLSAALVFTIVSILSLTDRRIFRERIKVLWDPLPIAAVVLSGLSLWLVTSWIGLDRLTGYLFFLRAINYRNGVSPLPPLFYAGLAGLVYVVTSLQRLRLVERVEGTLPILHCNVTSMRGIGLRELQVRNLSRRAAFRLPHAGTVAAIIAIGCFWAFNFPRLGYTFESGAFEWLLAVAAASLYLGLALTALRIALIWKVMKALLQDLESHPMVSAFQRFREKLPKDEKIRLSVGSSSMNAIARSVQLARQTSEAGFPGELAPLLQSAQRSLDVARLAPSKGHWRRLFRAQLRAREHLSRITVEITNHLEPEWESTGELVPVSGGSGGGTASESRGWREVGERFVASRVIEFVQIVLLELRSLATCVTLGVLLLLLCFGAYPYQPRDLFLTLNWLFILSLVVLALVVNVQINRNRVLSVVTESTPDRLTPDRDFIMRLVFHGVLPVLALLGAQFPSALGRFIPWLTQLLGGR